MKRVDGFVFERKFLFSKEAGRCKHFVRVAFSFHSVFTDFVSIWKMHGLYSHSTNNDDNESDPGGDAIKVYHRARLQRMATRTKDDLNQVLQRVESVS